MPLKVDLYNRYVIQITKTRLYVGAYYLESMR